MAQTVNFSDTTPAAASNTVNVKWQNDNASPPNISAYVPAGQGGAPNIPFKSVLTAQSAAITATTLIALTSSQAGMYRISYVATITTAASGGANGPSSTLGGIQGFQIKYTNAAGDSVVKTSNPGVVNTATANTTGASISGVVCGYCAASNNLQYLFGYSSVGTTPMVYDLAIFVEFLGT